MKVSKFINFKDGDEADIYADPVKFQNSVTFDSNTTMNGDLTLTSGTFSVCSNSINVGAGQAVTTTGNQTIGGNKTFSNTICGNLQGNVTGAVTGTVSGNAGSVTCGVYTCGAQTINDKKTFTDLVIPTSQPSCLVNGSIWVT